MPTEAQKKANKLYYQNNKEKVKAYVRAWRAKNHEKVLEQQRTYRKAENIRNTTIEENIVTIDGKLYKEIIRQGKDWKSTYLVQYTPPIND